MTAGECIRRAWLTLGAERVDLEDDAGGWFCTELDLGWPDVRDVTSNRPDQDGIDDRTRYLGARAIAATVVTVNTVARPSIDAVASMFAPFMVPSVRPELHYVLERPGNPERFFVVRAANYRWPIEGGIRRDIRLQWVAADPIARSVEERSAIAFAGMAGVSSGRTYNLTFDRTYPAGGGVPTTGLIRSDGDVPVRPTIRIWGPITAPVLTFSAPGATQTFRFRTTAVLAANQFYEIDSLRRTVTLNGDQSVYQLVDWSTSAWPYVPARTNVTMALQGGSTTALTQAVATWNDGWLE